MLMTASLDSSMKIFLIKFDINKMELKFDRSEKEITFMDLLGSNLVMTTTENSK